MHICINIYLHIIASVGSKPKLGSAQLGFGSSFWEKKLVLARLAMPSKKLGSAQLKTKNELISNSFANLSRYNLEELKKRAFFN